MLGCTLLPALRAQGRKVRTQSRGDGADVRADMVDPADARRALRGSRPAVIVNLIGLTDVDGCEEQPHQAYVANTRTVENLVAWIREEQPACHLVHISTDQVYDGAGPHVEETPRLTNYYAFSKYAGELAATSIASALLRTNFFGRSRCGRRKSLTDWLFASLTQGTAIQVFEDVQFSPLSMPTLAEMIGRVIEKRLVGTYNLGSLQGMSKADFAFAFAAAAGLPTAAMTRSSSDRAPALKAYRPKDMRMNVARIESALGVQLPTLNHEIERAAGEYREAS